MILRLVPLFGLIFALSSAPSVQAFPALTVKGGVTLSEGTAHDNVFFLPSMNLGGELTWTFAKVFDLGLGVEYNNLASQLGQYTALLYYSLVTRLVFWRTHIFADANIGVTHMTGDAMTSDAALGVGFGLGYVFSLGDSIELKPRLGFRNLPQLQAGTSLDRRNYELALLFTIRLI